MNKLFKTIFSAVLALALILIVAGGVSAAPDKEYRFGQTITIDNKNYLIASDKAFAEIFAIKADGKLEQVSEVHGAEKIEALYAGKNLNGKYFLILASGRYLYRYDISDPKTPKIEFRRDLYVFKRGQYKIGSVYCLAGSNDTIFGGGDKGARSFPADNLFVNKIYTHEKTYGLAADKNNLYVITADKGLVFDILTGNKLAETDLKNSAKTTRTPSFDDAGNAYFPSDEGLVRLNIFSRERTVYNNPAPAIDNFSYAEAVSPDGNYIYYANGHGLTLLDKNLKKVKFLSTSWQERYGAGAWAVGVVSAKIGARDAVVAFNKSSILLLDKDLGLLSRYVYKKSYPDYITRDLKIIPSVTLGLAGQKVNLQLSGYWPNENLAVNFGQKSFTVKVDNQGYAAFDVAAPNQAAGKTLIQAVGADSLLSYQTVFTIL